MLEIGLNNPADDPLTLEVEICPEDVGLSGPRSVTLPASSRGVYQLQYAPTMIGQNEAR